MNGILVPILSVELPYDVSILISTKFKTLCFHLRKLDLCVTCLVHL